MAVRVAILTSAPGGGAGIAAMRLYSALEEYPGCEPTLFDIEALGGPVPSDAAIPHSLSNQRLTNTHFTIEYPGDVRGWLVDALSNFDVVNVHWATYLISLGELDALTESGLPVLFTFHDYYFITGGCHYPAGCDGFLRECLGCPQVDSGRCEDWVIPINKEIKRRIFSRSNVHISAPSQFLADEAALATGIGTDRLHVIRNPYRAFELDIDPKCRDGLPRIVLMADSFSEVRKAMPLALDSLELACSQERFMVDLIGSPDPRLEKQIQNERFGITIHGRITEHRRICELLEQADLILTCSFEDNWPNILVEAACYGCIPVVGPGHGCAEFVQVMGAGSAARDYSADAFADALCTQLSKISEESRASLRQRARVQHSPQTVAEQYIRTISSIQTRND